MDDIQNVNLRSPLFRAVMEINQDGFPTIRFDTDEVPMSIQDAYVRVAGDGKARVSVTVDVGIKDFGTGVSSSCTVSLSCNQDQGTIQEAAQLAGDFARDFAKENRERADIELRQLMEERSQTR